MKFLNVPCGNGVRIETAVYNDYTIPPFYDSMIMKVITYAPTRLACIKKMRAALEELFVDGISTNIEFQYLLLHSPKFINGRYDTGYVAKYIKELSENAEYI